MAQQLVGVAAVGGLDRDADAGRGPTTSRSPRPNGGRRASRIRSAACAGLGRLGLLDEDRELVAAQAGDGVAGSRRRAQPLADGDEQPVALAVAEAVVDAP